MQKRLKQFFFFFIILRSFEAFSQDHTSSATDTLIAKFTKALGSDTREKIYVHTDKWGYIAGETIWFRAYCFYEISQKLSPVSKTIFVDLVSDKDSIVSQSLLNNQRLMTGGKIVLPANLPEGDYWLRSYTNAQLKKDTGAIFVKHIYVLNPGKSNSILLQPGDERKAADFSNTDNPQITFFPEGGSIIDGTDQVVAVRATDLQGNPLIVNGYLTNDKDSVFASFNTNNRGLGKFKYFVESMNKYIVHIKNNNGQNLTISLPGRQPDAARISVTNETDAYITILIALGDSLFSEKVPTTFLGINKDKIFYAARGKGMYQLEISKKNIPEGESHFLLFNQQQQIVSERAYYFTKNKLDVEIKPDKKNYLAREKVKLNIHVTDANNKPITALLSIAVTDNNLIKQSLDQEEFIDLASEETDLRMLTKDKNYLGWNWGTNSIVQPINISSDDQFIGIRGRVFDKKGVPQKNLVVTLFSNKDLDEMLFGTDTTNELGHFDFPLPNYIDSMSVQLQVRNLKGAQQDVNIELDSFQFPVFKTPDLLKIKYNETASIPLKDAKNFLLDTAVSKSYLSDTILMKGDIKLLKPVTVSTWKKKIATYDESKRVSQFSRILSWDMIAAGGINNLSNAMLTVPGVHMLGGKLNIHGPTSMTAVTEPLLIVDGAYIDLTHIMSPQVTSSSALLNYIDSYSPDDIDFIEVLTGPEAAYYGANGGNGVVIINTRTGPRKNANADKYALKQFNAKGYLGPILFEAPDYDNPEIKKSTYPDQRSTIYWNGNLLTDDNGKASIDFFTADSNTTYSVIMKGTTVSGEMVYKKIAIQQK